MEWNTTRTAHTDSGYVVSVIITTRVYYILMTCIVILQKILQNIRKNTFLKCILIELSKTVFNYQLSLTKYSRNNCFWTKNVKKIIFCFWSLKRSFFIILPIDILHVKIKYFWKILKKMVKKVRFLTHAFGKIH